MINQKMYFKMYCYTRSYSDKEANQKETGFESYKKIRELQQIFPLTLT